jgi:glycine dehydrogenase
MLMPALKPLTDSKTPRPSAARHIGPTPPTSAHAVASSAPAGRRALIETMVPAQHRAQPGHAPAAAGDRSAGAGRAEGAGRPQPVLKSFIGQGYHGTHTPGVILRNILENPAWYTAYTPYQAEISQGRMEALVNFQTMVCDLTGMAIANASHAGRSHRRRRGHDAGQAQREEQEHTFVVAGDCHPQTIEVIQTRAEPLGLKVVLANSAPNGTALIAGGDYFAALVQYPATSGWHPRPARRRRAHPRAPGGLHRGRRPAGADAAQAAGRDGRRHRGGQHQRFGVPMGGGGPHAAYLACRDEFKRSMPGRLVGVSIDSHGAPAYRLALQTREQHIRREKATSNICTAQVLLAVMASMYAVYHGPQGLKRIAQRVASYTAILAAGLRSWACGAHAPTAFDTLTHRHRRGHRRARRARAGRRHEPAPRLGRHMLGMALDETTTRDDIARCGAVRPPRPGAAFDDGGLRAGIET